MGRIINWMVQSNIFAYSLAICAISFCFRGTVHIVKTVLSIPDMHFRERLVTENFAIHVDLVLDTLIIAPVIETLVFQTLFFAIYKRFKIKRELIVLSSGLAFGFLHNYSIFYIINAAIIGFIFMYFYILRSEADEKPFISNVLAHSLSNAIVIIAVLLTRYFKFGSML